VEHFNAVAGVLASMSDAELEALSIHRFRAGFDIGSVNIPLLGSFEAQVRVDGQAQIDCTLIYRANGAFRIKVGTAGEIEGRAGGDVRYVVNKTSCVYEFKNARITGTLSGALNFPLTFIPWIGPALTAAGVQGRVELGAGGNFIWDAGADFPGWWSRATGSLRGSLGANWEKQLTLPLLGSGKVTGRLLGNVNAVINDTGLQPGNPLFSLSVLFRGEFTGFWGKKFFIDWTGTWPSTDIGPLGMDGDLFILNDAIADLGLYDETLNFSIGADVNTGTLNAYTGTGESNLTQNLYDEGVPVIAESPNGHLLAAWPSQEGIMISSWDSGAGAWSTPEPLPGSTGYSVSSLAAAYDGGGDLILVWDQLDTSSLGASSTSADIEAVLETGSRLVSTHYDADSATWSLPADLFDFDGSDGQIRLYRNASGDIIAAWANGVIGESSGTLYSATWEDDTDSWSSAFPVASGPISGAPSISDVGGVPSLVWAETVDSISGNSMLRYATWEGAGWSAASDLNYAFSESFASLLAQVASKANEEGVLMIPQGIPLPPVPEECCECKPEDIKRITESAPVCRDGGGTEVTFDEKTCTEKTIVYQPCATRPRDPNDIIGPAGYGDERWITAKEVMPYTIRFENAQDATAAAQEVVITQQLDSDLDWRTFRVDDFGFGDQRVELAADQSFYKGRLDFSADHGFYLDVVASIDATTGIATWKITTIDPATGEIPVDPTLGFLPPNKNPDTGEKDGRGEGFVSYTVKAKRTAHTGDVVDAQATIVFDTEGPIDTPPYFNTLDAVAPSSEVTPFASATTADTGFLVSWAATDDGGGSAVADYTVYYSVDGGDYGIWLFDTPITEALFTGAAAHTYAFYSTARDNAGNEEAAPDIPDATITVEGFGSLSGLVFEDMNGNGSSTGDPGLASWTVYLDADGDGQFDAEELSATTTADGTYSFDNLLPGTYRVREVVQAGWDLTAPVGESYDVIVSAGEPAVNINFGNFELVQISGIVFHDLNNSGTRDVEEPALPGWRVFLDLNDNGEADDGEQYVDTGADGAYILTGAGPGQVTVGEVIPEGWVRTTPEITSRLNSGSPLTFDLGNVQLGSLSGVKYNDLDGDGQRDEGEPGLEDWTIFIDSNANGFLDQGEASTQTGQDGSYTFSSLMPGQYILAEVGKPGWMQTSPLGSAPGGLTGLTTSGSQLTIQTMGFG
jgi:hypothetical protein